jgi:hypothetical protein
MREVAMWFMAIEGPAVARLGNIKHGDLVFQNTIPYVAENRQRRN